MTWVGFSGATCVGVHGVGLLSPAGWRRGNVEFETFLLTWGTAFQRGPAAFHADGFMAHSA